MEKGGGGGRAGGPALGVTPQHQHASTLTGRGVGGGGYMITVRRVHIPPCRGCVLNRTTAPRCEAALCSTVCVCVCVLHTRGKYR